MVVKQVLTHCFFLARSQLCVSTRFAAKNPAAPGLQRVVPAGCAPKKANQSTAAMSGFGEEFGVCQHHCNSGSQQEVPCQHCSVKEGRSRSVRRNRFVSAKFLDCGSQDSSACAGAKNEGCVTAKTRPNLAQMRLVTGARPKIGRGRRLS